MVAKVLKDVIEQAETWPQEDQVELAGYAREIQARHTGVYIMSDEERAAVRRGLARRKQTNATTNEGSVHSGRLRGSRNSPSGARNVMASIRDAVKLLSDQPYRGYRTDDPDVRVSGFMERGRFHIGRLCDSFTKGQTTGE